MRRLPRRDRRDGVTVLGAEATQHVEHLANLAHWLANFTETIGELLEVLGVLSNVHVFLDKTPELGRKVDCAMKFIVAELGVDAVPDAVGGGVWRANDGAHVLGDRVVLTNSGRTDRRCGIRYRDAGSRWAAGRHGR